MGNHTYLESPRWDVCSCPMQIFLNFFLFHSIFSLASFRTEKVTPPNLFRDVCPREPQFPSGLIVALVASAFPLSSKLLCKASIHSGGQWSIPCPHSEYVAMHNFPELKSPQKGLHPAVTSATKLLSKGCWCHRGLLAGGDSSCGFLRAELAGVSLQHCCLQVLSQPFPQSLSSCSLLCLTVSSLLSSLRRHRAEVTSWMCSYPCVRVRSLA